MSITLVRDLEAKGVSLEVASKLTFQSTQPLDAETVNTLKANRDDLLTYLRDHASLYSQALALMEKHGVLHVDCGTYAFTLYHHDSKRLVEARLSYPWGIIGTTGNKALMKWCTPPEDAYEEWNRRLEPPVELSDEALELLRLYDLGELPPHIHNRLTELFTDPPHDISERLERAALHVRQQTETR